MKKLIAAGAVLALVLPSIAMGKPSLKVSPTSVAPGGTLKVSGSGCKKGKTVTLFSAAFKGGNPAKGLAGRVQTKAKKGGKFSAKASIATTLTAGKYHVNSDCGTKTLTFIFFTVT